MTIEGPETSATSLALDLTVPGRAVRHLELLGRGPEPPPARVSLVLPDGDFAVGIDAVLVGSRGVQRASASLTSRAHAVAEVTLDFGAADLGSASQTYVGAVLASKPSSFYRLADSSGMLAVDAAGLSPGSYFDPTTRRVNSLVGNDGDFAVALGLGGKMTVPFSVDTSNSTLEVLFQPLEFSNYSAGIFYQEVYQVGGFRMGATRQGGVILWTNESGGTVPAMTTKPGVVLAGTTHHIAVTFAPGLATVYVDGAVSSAGDLGVAPTTNNLWIGQIAGLDSSAIIDEAAIYPRPLSADEIAAHVAAWKAGL